MLQLEKTSPCIYRTRPRAFVRLQVAGKFQRQTPRHVITSASIDRREMVSLVIGGITTLFGSAVLPARATLVDSSGPTAVQIVQKIYDDFSKRDVQAMVDAVSDSFKLTSYCPLLDKQRVFCGKAGFQQYLDIINTKSETKEFEVISLHGNDVEVTAMCRDKAVLKKKKGPKPVEVYIGHRWQVDNGKVVGLLEVVSDGKTARAASHVPSGRAVEESSPSLVEPSSTDVSANSAVTKVDVSDITPPLPTTSKAAPTRRKPPLRSSAATMAAAAKEAMSGAAVAGSSKVAEAVAAAPNQAAEAATAVETGVREAVGTAVKAVK